MLERCKDRKTTVTWEGKSPRNIYGILEIDNKLKVKELQKGRSHGHGSVRIVRRSKLSMHFKGEQTDCSQGVLLTRHPEELWVFQEEEGKGESSGKEEEDTNLAFGTFLWVVRKRKQPSLPG